MQIDKDDNPSPFDIMELVNEDLAPHGLIFVNDDDSSYEGPVTFRLMTLAEYHRRKEERRRL